MNQSRRRMARLASALPIIVALSLGTSASWAQQKSLKSQLAGAWTLVSQEVTPKDGAKRPGTGGPNVKGILILDASGHYAFVAGAPDRPKLKTTVRRDIPAAELGEATRTFAANYGTWSVEGDKTLIRKFQLAVIPNNDNQEVKYTVSLAKGELKLVQVTAAGATVETVYRRAK